VNKRSEALEQPGELAMSSAIPECHPRPTRTRLGILSTIGNTPLVGLSRLSLPGVQLIAKLEFLNPGGSMKDRAAFAMLREAQRRGAITEATVIVESSSGNMGIGLAQACSYLGLRFLCVTDVKTTSQNIRLLRAYGAEVIVVEKPHPVTNELLDARLAKVQEILSAHRDSYWPNQYENAACMRVHFEHTAREIVEELGFFPTVLFCPASTCGTVAGLLSYFREMSAPTRIVAVDLIGSIALGGMKGPRLIPGLGSARQSSFLDRGQVDEVVYVSEAECVRGCRLLASREAILAGGSSGAAIAAALRASHSMPPGATIVVILPDRGERYLETVYNDDWVNNTLGLTEGPAHRRIREDAADVAYSDRP
jgi:2,3-diaminopropionate biosynthesis protein SbnA